MRKVFKLCKGLLICICLLLESVTICSSAKAEIEMLTATANQVVVNGVPYRTLRVGTEGDEVLQFKQHMQDLGYFSTAADYIDRFNIIMEYKFKKYQNAFGEKATDVATPELQAYIDPTNGGLPTPTPKPSSKPTPEPSKEPIDEVASDSVAVTGIDYRTLKLGTSGEDVRLFKLRLQELGYYTLNAVVSDHYNKTMEHKVIQYQKDLGMDATGVVTPELQIAGFSDYGGLTTPVPLPLPIIPNLTEEGFLPSNGDEFIYENSELGQWIYLSDSLRIEITRYNRQGHNPLVWFETIIRFTDIDAFQRFEVINQYKKTNNTEYPSTIASRNNLVLAFNDDFYGFRKNRKYKQGIIIINGEILSDDPYDNIVSYLPPLDVMAFFPDGSAKVFYSNEYSAEELLAMGVKDTQCFGPVLLQNGEFGQQVADGKYSTNDPRCALGMIKPRHFVLITVEGRHSDSQGVSMSWLAMRMKDLGAREAINLDGGNTTALVFRGQLLNKIGNYIIGKTTIVKGVRSVSSVIGIGLLQTPVLSEDE
jgi:peptidoglycan hydrolase-like protein with peptidoglycan-binding domain